MIDWIDHLNREVMQSCNTRLVGGFPEPFYRAADGDAPAEIQFTRNYERSALHELAHWCVAGNTRRQHDDYGYWYEPDGRSSEQQKLFFEVEVKPQAIESHFCDALQITFDVSVDNLDNTNINGIEAFRRNVETRYTLYTTTGLPERASVIYKCLQQWMLEQGRQE